MNWEDAKKNITAFSGEEKRAIENKAKSDTLQLIKEFWSNIENVKVASAGTIQLDILEYLDRIDALTNQLEAANDRVNYLVVENDRLSAENTAMREALEWYGSKGHTFSQRARDVLYSLSQGTRSRRDTLLKRLEQFSVLPKPDIESKTDDELERYVKLLESSFEMAFDGKAQPTTGEMIRNHDNKLAAVLGEIKGVGD
ncbi:hypothetical protein ACFSL6_17855 [Paenibacillus thailandensis]|uniref:Uncharacterized protein n=1 Tax=Paenibacillus thailandensis TaxID=393250 RepID=A0ABW5R2X1_9BACL